jgi:hypothetical protein
MFMVTGKYYHKCCQTHNSTFVSLETWLSGNLIWEVITQQAVGGKYPYIEMTPTEARKTRAIGS